MKKNTFKVLFYIRGNQINKEGKAPIMIRITIDGEVEQLNSKLTIEPQLWDVAASKAKGRSAKILELNSRLNDIQVIMKDHYYDIQRRHGYVTAEMVKNAYMGITAREESLLKLYEQHLEDTKKLVGLSKADPTYQKYERMYRRVVEFMKMKYNITDIPLREIKLSFITDLEFFLRTEYKYSQNTTYKCMKAVSEGAIVKVLIRQCAPEHGRQPFSLMVKAASPMPFHKAMAVVGVQHCP